jgi:hypothetical protein
MSLKLITADIVEAAQRSSAAYFTHPDQSKAVFEHLGYTWIGLWQNGSSQAVLSMKDGQIYVSIAGTRASAWKLEDIFLDVDLTPMVVDAASNSRVTCGVHADLVDLWAWVLLQIHAAMSASTVIHVDGHSLGGARTQLTPLFVATQHIGNLYSFEAPKFADANYFAKYMTAMPNLVCTLNGADGWAAWPWIDHEMVRPPIPHLWLKETSWFEWIEPSEWPGGMNFADHDIDAVVKKLQMFANATPPSMVIDGPIKIPA